MTLRALLTFAILICISGPACSQESGATGRISFAITEAASGAAVPCRIHLADASGRPFAAEDCLFWRDHFVCNGAAVAVVPAGEYRYQIERGPEYVTVAKSVVVRAGETTVAVDRLVRAADLSREGWWAGDLQIHHRLPDMRQVMRAEDLHIGVLITSWNTHAQWKRDNVPPQNPIVEFDTHRFCDVMGSGFERAGGALLFSHLREPRTITAPTAGWPRVPDEKLELPASGLWLAETRARGAWSDAQTPFWWDFPHWLSSGRLDSVQIAHSFLQRDRALDHEAWGKPRDRDRWPGPHGNGLWTQEIYYHALNCGFRLPPSAGSAGGRLPNPTGFNRVYAHVEGNLTWEKWWEALRAGRSFVTNGPLLRVRANDRLPGGNLESAGPLEIVLEGALDSRDPIAAVELVMNGRVEPLALPARLRIDESGWFLVRVRTEVAETFRFASTAPWYVKIAGRPPCPARASCQFFLRWVEERIAKLEQLPFTNYERREVLWRHQETRQFWCTLLNAAD